MWLGVDYYPEQCDPALMGADMDTILEMGGSVIRIAEFSWHLMEKAEGNFDFSFFDKVIAKAREKGLHVIMDTPTAAIPAWLAKKHPGILSQLENGQRRAFGGRHVCCYNSSELYAYSEKSAKGAEQFCFGVINADNVKGRKFQEVRSFFADISQYEQALSAPIRSRVAIVYDYDSLASLRIQRQSVLLDCQNEMKKLYQAFYDKNAPVDVIPADSDLSPYRVVLLPQMIIAGESFRQRAADFVRRGGTLVLTFRTAVKDSDNNLPFGQRVPVGFGELDGVTAEETESLQKLNAFPVTGENSFAGETGFGGTFRDMLQLHDAEVLYRYGDPFYRDYAAVIRKRQGSGTLTSHGEHPAGRFGAHPKRPASVCRQTGAPPYARSLSFRGDGGFQRFLSKIL